MTRIVRPQAGPQEHFLSTEADVAVFGGSAGGGKLLRLDTPVPTPSGWTTMGDLKDGSVVFDAAGTPCTVVKAHPVDPSPKSYCIRFDDGEEIFAGADHLWLTFDYRERVALTNRTDDRRARRRSGRVSRSAIGAGTKWRHTLDHRRSLSERMTEWNLEHPPLVLPPPVGTVRTTSEIAETLLVPGSSRLNHSVPVCGALILPDVSLPLDPYLLGVWLGDGTRKSGMIAQHEDDAPEVLGAFQNAGFSVRKTTADYGYYVRGLVPKLREAGVLEHKHVPALYLRASAAQRLALLQGLMDTDGSADKRGQVAFGTTSPALRDAVYELAVSLGWKVGISVRRSKLNGHDYGPAWVLKWSATDYVFRLKRKLARQRLAVRRTTRFRYVVKCARVESVPMRCITVDSPSRLYLVGRGMVPTHNTFGLLLEPLRHIKRGKFRCVLFRRTYPEISNPGGMWDESYGLYKAMGAEPRQTTLEWMFPADREGNRAVVKMAHMQHEDDKKAWDGAQIPVIGFDQLECLHPEAEVLTSDGWRQIAKVEPGERVATLSPDREIEFRPAVLVTHEFDGELLACRQGRRGLAFRVTPNHRFVVDRQDSAESWGFKFAPDLFDRIARTGRWTGVEREWYDVKTPVPTGRGHAPHRTNGATRAPMDAWTSFLGWWLSEGCTHQTRRGVKGVNITQCDESKVAEIRRVLSQLPWRFTEKRRERPRGKPITYFWIWSSQLYDELRELGTRAHDKRVPRWLLDLSQRQLQLFWNAFVAGDGSISRSGGVTIGLASPGLIDDLQEVAFRLGLVATQSRPRVVRGRFTVHVLSVSRPERTSTTVRASTDLARERYVGPVYCLSVPPYANFLVRVDGRYFWSGNSFSAEQFWYMFSRNRDAHGTTSKPYVRATCNPVPKDDPTGGWLRELLTWWIDDETGYAISARSGVIRYFIRVDDDLVWGDSREELEAVHPGRPATSFTFIRSTLADNKILETADPGYRAKLLNMSRVERERLLDGNWNVRPTAGKVFDMAWFEIVPEGPRSARRVRFWDKAATEEKGTGTTGRRGDPDYSAGVLVAWDEERDLYYIEDVVHGRWSSERRNAVIRQTAALDGPEVAIRMEQEPGSGGKESAEISVRQLSGYNVRAEPSTGDKLSYMYPLSAQAERGRVKLVQGGWNKKFLAEAHAIPEGKHDDMLDAASKGFCKLTLTIGVSVRLTTPGAAEPGVRKRVVLVG